MTHNHSPTPVFNSSDNPRSERYRQTIVVTLVGSVIDLVLGVTKILVGFSSYSQALVADGVHSLSDLATDVLVLYAAKHAHREADEEHPYGHGRIETAATVALGIALIGVAVGIGIDAIRGLFDPGTLKHPGVLALTIATISIGAKEAIYHYTMRVARKFRSEILKANAWHSRSDAISSVVVVIGIAGTMAGLDYLDAVAAIIVTIMIAQIGWQLAWNSVRELVDTALEKDRVEAIQQTIKSVEGVQALHQLRSRRMGPDALVDVHIQVSPTLTVSEGHQISETVRFKLMHEIEEVSDVTVHIDPEDDEVMTAGGTLPLRQTLIKRLEGYFEDIEEARHIKDVTLHYLQGKIQVEIVLPLSVLSDTSDATKVLEKFQRAIKEDDDVVSIKLLFY
ncbi:MAG: cation diffusion facilitator family transporter [Gammaproteobacteria bacterium]|nr:MAG: cation diffusion facilitator family transporter [Gammaproteobacteria bacterium]